MEFLRLSLGVRVETIACQCSRVAVPGGESGVLAVAAPTSDQFALNWNRLVLR